jgi:hypothetical protein
MQVKVLLSLGTILAALSTGVLAGPASARTSDYPCGAAALFASQGDQAGYLEMHAAGGQRGELVYKASCVHFLEPFVRVVAQNVGDPNSTLTVSVQYKDSDGSHDDTIGTLSGFGEMQASPVLAFAPSGFHGNVRVTLTSSGSLSDWLVDGVYIDPYMSR